MQVSVIGGAGFIGSALAKRLMHDGHRVIVYDNFSTGTPENFGHEKPTIRRFDVSKPEDWKEFKPTDLIFSLACFPRSISLNEPEQDLHTNYYGTLRGLEAARKYGAAFIFASNTGIVSNPDHLPVDETFPDMPITPYDNHKLASEHLIRIFATFKGVPGMVFRFASVYGPNQRCHENLDWHPIVPHFASLMKQGQRPRIDGTGEQTRDFIFVDDIVDGLVLGMKHLVGGDWLELSEKIILGTNTQTSINQLHAQLASILGFRKPPDRGPERLADIKNMRYDFSKAKRILGWSPKVTLKEGLKKTVLGD